MFWGVFWTNRYFICCSAPCWSCWTVCLFLNTPTSVNVPLCNRSLNSPAACVVVGCSLFTVLCLCWLCAGLCCVPVVFDSGRCSVPHGHQFSTDPTRGRQRAELISIHFKYWNSFKPIWLLCHSSCISLCVCIWVWTCTHMHTNSNPLILPLFQLGVQFFDVLPCAFFCARVPCWVMTKQIIGVLIK